MYYIKYIPRAWKSVGAVRPLLLFSASFRHSTILKVKPVSYLEFL